MFKSNLLLALSVFILSLSHLAIAQSSGIIEGASLKSVSVSDVTLQILPGSILIVSEQHDLLAHHERQWEMLEALVQSPKISQISVGMEFFESPFQNDVDAFLSGQILEVDFLKKIGMKLPTFDFYRKSVLFPATHGGKTLAINSPRALTQKVAKTGLDSLTEDEKKLLPPDFTLGNPGYYERFKETMSGHIPNDAIDRYFAAQSIWDESMASNSVRYLDQNPNQVLVIIVGDFHAAYGGGLPDRLRARGSHPVYVMSQVSITGLADAEKKAVLEPSSKYGPRADWVSWNE